MTRTLSLFVAGSLAGIAALAGVGYARDQWYGVCAALGAGFICLLPTTASLAFTLWSKDRSVSDQLMAVMGGMVFRMACVLGLAMAVRFGVPMVRETRERELLFWGSVATAYIGTLAWETILTARARKVPATVKVGE